MTIASALPIYSVASNIRQRPRTGGTTLKKASHVYRPVDIITAIPPFVTGWVAGEIPPASVLTPLCGDTFSIVQNILRAMTKIGTTGPCFVFWSLNQLLFVLALSSNVCMWAVWNPENTKHHEDHPKPANTTIHNRTGKQSQLFVHGTYRAYVGDFQHLCSSQNLLDKSRKL